MGENPQINQVPAVLRAPNAYLNGGEHPLARKIAAGTLALGLGVASVAGIVSCGSNNHETAGATDATDTTMSPEDLAALKELLTVDSSDVSCVDIVETAGATTVNYDNGKVYAYDIGATKPVGEGNRLWSDAISTPFGADKSDKVALMTQLQTAICEDPELGSTIGKMFANMDVEGVKVVDLNSWLQESAGDTTTINDLAEAYAPLTDHEGDVSDEDAEAAAEENQNYQVFAQRLITLLSRFQNDGAQTGMTTFNYHLEAGGLVAVGLPEVGLNMDQMNADHLQLTLTKKPGICVLSIGFNLGDKRPEGFECVTPTPGNVTVTSKGEVHVTTTQGGENHPTTTFIGPKNAKPPVSGGPSTTVEAPNPGEPTTSTTAKPDRPTPSTVPNTTTTLTPPTSQPPRP